MPLRLISITIESNQVERDKPVYAFLYVAKTGVSIKETQMYRRNKFDSYQNSKDFLNRNFSILLKTKKPKNEKNLCIRWHGSSCIRPDILFVF